MRVAEPPQVGQPPDPAPGATYRSGSRMSMTKIVLLVALGLTILTGAAVAATEALTHRETTTQTLSLPVERVVVTAEAGDVRLVAARAQRVTIVTHRRWLWRRPTVRAAREGSTLRVRADCPKVGLMDRCAADLELRLPFDTDVAVSGDAGDISADGLAGHVELRTGAGDISGTNLVPVSLMAATEAGDLDLEFATSPVSVEARSDAGDVAVAVPAGEYRVDTFTDAGELDVRGVLRNDRSFRRIDARTDAGDVTVRGVD